MQKFGLSEELLETLGLAPEMAWQLEGELEEYLRQYHDCFANISQKKYFETFVRALLSPLARKSIEPVATAFLSAGEVRAFQQFFSRARLPEERLLARYHQLLARQTGAPGGFVYIGCECFPKKGAGSAGVLRQRNEATGREENVQTAVWAAYASERGCALAEMALYLPPEWCTAEYAVQRKKCDIPGNEPYKTKADLAEGLLAILAQTPPLGSATPGYCATFTAHGALPAAHGINRPFFADVHAEKTVYLYSRADTLLYATAPQKVAHNDAVPWRSMPVGTGAGSYKCVQCEVQPCNGRFAKGGPGMQWLFVHRAPNGQTRFFLSNAPEDTPEETLCTLALRRAQVEEMMQRSRMHLGMAHYETRSYVAWRRHMLMVMIAGLFTEIVRCGHPATQMDNALARGLA